MRVFVISSSVPFNILAIYPIPFSSSSVIFLLFLLLIRLLYPFYYCQYIFNIHILQRLQQHFCHYLRRIRFGCCLLTKWWMKELPSCSKLSMDDIGSLVNHSLAAPLRVVGKEWHSISSRGYWSPRVILKVLRWSKGFFSPSNGSSCGRQNF